MAIFVHPGKKIRLSKIYPLGRTVLKLDEGGGLQQQSEGIREEVDVFSCLRGSGEDLRVQIGGYYGLTEYLHRLVGD